MRKSDRFFRQFEIIAYYNTGYKWNNYPDKGSIFPEWNAKFVHSCNVFNCMQSKMVKTQS